MRAPPGGAVWALKRWINTSCPVTCGWMLKSPFLWFPSNASDVPSCCSRSFYQRAKLHPDTRSQNRRWFIHFSLIQEHSRGSAAAPGPSFSRQTSRTDWKPLLCSVIHLTMISNHNCITYLPTIPFLCTIFMKRQNFLLSECLSVCNERDELLPEKPILLGTEVNPRQLCAINNTWLSESIPSSFTSETDKARETVRSRSINYWTDDKQMKMSLCIVCKILYTLRTHFSIFTFIVHPLSYLLCTLVMWRRSARAYSRPPI